MTQAGPLPDKFGDLAVGLSAEFGETAMVRFFSVEDEDRQL
jgi:hypothetical protein